MSIMSVVDSIKHYPKIHRKNIYLLLIKYRLAQTSFNGKKIVYSAVGLSKPTIQRMNMRFKNTL